MINKLSLSDTYRNRNTNENLLNNTLIKKIPDNKH